MSRFPILCAEDAGYAVHGRPLLSGVSVSFQAGDFAAVVGPNGSGKTTLLRLLAGVRGATSGAVLLEGRPIEAFSRPEIARRLSYLPQNTWTDFDVPVSDAVAMGRLPYLGAWRAMGPEDVEAVGEAMRRVGVSHLASRTLPTLSGGERQRVFIARALAQGSDIFVLDEPTSALDVGHQLDLMEALAGLHAEGKTVIAAVHDLHLVWRFFPRAILIDRGRVTADGPARQALSGEAARAAFQVAVEGGVDGEVRFTRVGDAELRP
jgi:iron complex transport system ATP-binding protein